MLEPPGSRAAVPEGCSGVLNWEHWEAWICVGTGRAWGWVGLLVSVVHQRAGGPGYLPALHPSAAGPGGISIREPPIVSPKMPTLGCQGETYLGVTPPPPPSCLGDKYLAPSVVGSGV